MYYLYILECEDGSLYTGIAKDVQLRFEKHIKGVGARYTRQHKPVRILYTEELPTQGDALKRELQIKGWTRKKKFSLIGNTPL